MPDKQKDSKIITMLERKGIIRKAEDDASETSSGLYSTDIRPVFEAPDYSAPVRQAHRQPVPGMQTPVYPSDNTSTWQAKQAPQVADVPEAEATYTAPVAPVSQAFTETPAPITYAEPQRPASSFSGMNLFKNGNASTDPPFSDSSFDDYDSGSGGAENYTNKYLNVNELYDALALRSKKTDSIYLIEDYLETLPNSLPDSQRREIVGKLLAASGFDYDLLMGDGVLRVKMLKEYAERFARHTDDYIAARQAELDELNQQVQRTMRLVDNRKELHKKQFYTIESEAQRLKEILTFISG